MNKNIDITPFPGYIQEEVSDMGESEQTQLWKQMDIDNLNMYLKKNSDYGAANVLYMGTPGILIRIWDKICRLYSLFGIQLPNFARLFDIRKEQIKKDLTFMLGKDVDESWLKALHSLIDLHFSKLEKECRVDFSKYSERIPQNESILDAFSDLELYARIGNISHRQKWGR